MPGLETGFYKGYVNFTHWLWIRLVLSLSTSHSAGISSPNYEDRLKIDQSEDHKVFSQVQLYVYKQDHHK